VDLMAGDYESLPSAETAWVWRRGARTVVALNMSDEATKMPWTGPPARIAIGTDRRRDGTPVTADVSLGPWEGVVVFDGP
jgi:hypothetical protein